MDDVTSSFVVCDWVGSGGDAVQTVNLKTNNVVGGAVRTRGVGVRSTREGVVGTQFGSDAVVNRSRRNGCNSGAQ